MMPVMTHFDHPYENHTNPEVRRMAMLNRARRDEMDAMILNLSTRHHVWGAQSNSRTRESLVNRMRAAIGNTLIAAGNRIQAAQ